MLHKVQHSNGFKLRDVPVVFALMELQHFPVQKSAAAKGTPCSKRTSVPSHLAGGCQRRRETPHHLTGSLGRRPGAVNRFFVLLRPSKKTQNSVVRSRTLACSCMINPARKCATTITTAAFDSFIWSLQLKMITMLIGKEAANPRTRSNQWCKTPNITLPARKCCFRTSMDVGS